jgi:ribosomal protein L11 methyltransferase
MNQCVCFILKKDADVDEAWQELASAGIEVLYSVEDPVEGNQIYGNIKNNDLPTLRSVSSVKYIELTIDWESQWAAHGLDFHDGLVHIDLGSFGYDKGGIVRLAAGPGFGDLSHPTTRLMLKMIAKNPPRGQYVLDIGSGSGVLSICAHAMGADHVYGVDIDPEAIVHAKTNAEVNEMHKEIEFGLPADYQIPSSAKSAVILMNMISSEQKVAWESLPQIHSLKGEMITSGILKEQKKSYLKLFKSWGWNLVETMEEEGWMCFRMAKE